jgi:hypothetical protein
MGGMRMKNTGKTRPDRITPVEAFGTSRSGYPGSNAVDRDGNSAA